MREAYTDRTYFIWLVPLHYIIHIDTNQLFFLGEMHKLQISVILAGFFKFSLHWLSEGRGHFPLGKGVLFWLFALELYFQQHFKRDLFTRSPIFRGFQKHGFIGSPKNVVLEDLDFDAAVLPRTGTQQKGGHWGMKLAGRPRGSSRWFFRFCYCKNGWKTCLQSWKTILVNFQHHSKSLNISRNYREYFCEAPPSVKARYIYVHI